MKELKPLKCDCGNEQIQLGVIETLLTERCFMYCYNCGKRGPEKRSERAAIDAWNKTMKELKAKRKSTLRHTRKSGIVGGGR